MALSVRLECECVEEEGREGVSGRGESGSVVVREREMRGIWHNKI